MSENCGFQPIGLLYFTPPQLQQHLEANIAMQRAVSVNTRIIDPTKPWSSTPRCGSVM